MNRNFLASIAAVAALLGGINQHTLAQGIPEPPLVLYGTIRNAADNNVRLTMGTLTWQFRKISSGRIVTVTTQVSNVLDQFSYVLQVPCETILAGFTVSTTALDLTPTAAAFDRSTVSLDTHAVTFVTPSQASASIASTDRGRLERVDLLVNIAIVDQDGNGLPDDWEDYFFGYVGVDPNADDDHDGMSNLAEYRAGTDPTDPNSCLKFVQCSKVSGGFSIEWSSAEGRLYTLQRSSSLLSGFSTLTNHVAATPPQNLFLDAAATGPGPYFYRIRLE